MKEYLVLRVITKLLLPFILLFGLYVQFHGDFGPGGGFQTGVIFAAGFVLYSLVYGVKAAQRVLPTGILRAGIAGGLLLYTLVGVANLMLGEKLSELHAACRYPEGRPAPRHFLGRTGSRYHRRLGHDDRLLHLRHLARRLERYVIRRSHFRDSQAFRFLIQGAGWVRRPARDGKSLFP